MFVEAKAKGEVELDAASDILLRAATLLELKGHCNWAATGPDGSLCVHAALMEVADTAHDTPALVEARRRLVQGINEETITYWSNASTKEKVVAKLRAVAFSS